MKSRYSYNVNGFTMVEVILVMGIAGLIFLMMLVALPALQRAQRDSQREEDITSFIAHLKTYQDNHRGALPHTPDSGLSDVTKSSTNEWGYFYNEVFDNDFVDPSGNPYVLEISKCNGTVSDAECEDDYGAIYSSEFPNGYKLYIVEQAKCSSDESMGVVATSLLRRFAVLYKLENGGVYCAEG